METNTAGTDETPWGAIAEYVSDRMTPEARVAFERRLAGDASLRATVERMQAAMRAWEPVVEGDALEEARMQMWERVGRSIRARDARLGGRWLGTQTLQNILRFPISKRVVHLMLGLVAIMMVTAKAVTSHSALVRATTRTAPTLLLDTLRLVRFLLDAPPGARTIAITGNFTGHGESRTSLQYDRAHGQWSGVLVLAPGTYHYRFVVDDTGRLLDPHARTTTDEDGRRVSVVTVTASSAHLPNPARIPHDT